MSYTTGTTHYNLPQTVGTDKRDWSDTNQAFQDVDAALYGAVQDTAQAASNIDALEARMDTAEQNIANNTGDIAGLDTRLTTAESAITSQASQITDTRQDLEDMICAFNEASATSTHRYEVGDYFIYNDVLYRAIQVIAIGDTIVPDTNCTTTNVTSELLNIIDNFKPTVLAQVTCNGTDSVSTILDSISSTVLGHVNITDNIKLLHIENGTRSNVFSAFDIKPDRIIFTGSNEYISSSNIVTQSSSVALRVSGSEFCYTATITPLGNGVTPTFNAGENSSDVFDSTHKFVVIKY